MSESDVSLKTRLAYRQTLPKNALVALVNSNGDCDEEVAYSQGPKPFFDAEIFEAIVSKKKVSAGTVKALVNVTSSEQEAADLLKAAGKRAIALQVICHSWGITAKTLMEFTASKRFSHEKMAQPISARLQSDSDILKGLSDEEIATVVSTAGLDIKAEFACQADTADEALKRLKNGTDWSSVSAEGSKDMTSSALVMGRALHFLIVKFPELLEDLTADDAPGSVVLAAAGSPLISEEQARRVYNRAFVSLRDSRYDAGAVGWATLKLFYNPAVPDTCADEESQRFLSLRNMFLTNSRRTPKCLDALMEAAARGFNPKRFKNLLAGKANCFEDAYVLSHWCTNQPSKDWRLAYLPLLGDFAGDAQLPGQSFFQPLATQVIHAFGHGSVAFKAEQANANLFGTEPNIHAVESLSAGCMAAPRKLVFNPGEMTRDGTVLVGAVLNGTFDMWRHAKGPLLGELTVEQWNILFSLLGGAEYNEDFFELVETALCI